MIRPGFSSSHIMRVLPPEPLQPGDTSGTLEIDFSAGAGWLIALQTSIQNEDFEFDVLFRSKIAMRLIINNEDPYTGSGRGADYVVLSDFQGDWCHWHPMSRRMEPTDNLYVTWRHIGDSELVLPSLSLQYLRDADFTGMDLTDLEELLGLPGYG